MSTSTLNVPAVGTVCKIGDNIPAVITAVMFRGKDHHVSLEVTWWDGRQRREAWVDSSEVEIVMPSAQPVSRIGFGGQ